MAYELSYTSLPNGLRPGTSGFCTVGLTRGTPATVVERLESLSGYRPLYPASSPNAAQNPVAWAHWRVNAGTQSFDVLSRVSFAGLDYTQRSNKFAHHVAMAVGELPAGGPAWALSQPGFMRTGWSGAPTEYETGPAIPRGDLPADVCRAWANVCDDPGWAGTLADSFLNHPSRPSYLIYPVGTDVLALLREAIALVPGRQRWQVTFNTYFTDLPAGSTCAWRCCADGSPAADEARKAGGVVIDLTVPLPAAPDSVLARVARNGPGHEPINDAVMAVIPSPLAESELDDRYEPLPLAKPMAVAAATVGSKALPTRSTLQPPPAARPKASAPPADQSWMPPVSSTIVEPAEGYAAGESAPPASAGVRRVAIAALLAAVLASGATYIGMRSKIADEVSAAEGRVKADLTKQSAALQAKATADHNALVSLREEFEKSKVASEAKETEIREAEFRKGQESPDPHIWQKKIADTPKPVDGIPPEVVKKQIEAAVAAERAKHLNNTTQVPTPPPTPSVAGSDTLPLKPLNLPTVPGPQPMVFLLDDLPNTTETVFLGKVAAKAKNVRCELVALAADPVLNINNDKSGQKSQVYVTDAALGQKIIEQCAISIVDGKLQMTWPQLSDEKHNARRKFLKTCMLTVKDDSGSQGTVQFWPMTVQDLELAKDSAANLDNSAITDLKLPANSVKLTILPDQPSPPSNWKMREAGPATGTTSYTFSEPTGTGVKVYLSEGNLLKSDFAKLFRERTQAQDQIQKELNDLAATFPRKGSDIDWAQMPNKGTAEKSKYEAKQKEVAGAAALLKSLATFPNGVALVQLKNGVILHRINLVTRIAK